MKNFRFISLAIIIAITYGAWAQDGKGAMPLPYKCDFSSAEKFAEEWTVVNNNNDYSTWEFIDWDPGSDGMPGCAYCQTNGVTGNDDYLISMPLTLEAGDNHVTFSAKGVRSDGIEAIELYYGDSDDVSRMTLVKKWNITGNTWRVKAATFNVPVAGAYHIALRSVSTEGYSTYVDDIKVDKGPAELSPNLTITGIETPYSQCDYSAETPVGVTITNNGTGDATEFTLAYKINGTAIPAETFNLTINPDSTITVYPSVRADMEATGRYDIEATLTCGGKTTTETVTATHKDIVTQLPLDCDFSTGTGEYWAGRKADTWKFDPMGSCYRTTVTGRGNGLFSPCMYLDRPVRLNFAYSGGLFNITAKIRILLGPSGTDVSTWRTVYYDDKVDNNGAQKEIAVHDIEPGLYSIAIVNEADETDISLNIYYINISKIYDYDIKADEMRSAMTAYMPAGQYNSEGTYTVTVNNRGTEPIKEVTTSMNIDGSRLFENTQKVDLQPDNTAQVTVTGSMPEAAAGDIIRGAYITADIEGEKYAADNRIEIGDVVLTDSVFATENITDFTRGIGLSGQTAKFGNVYTLNTADTLTSVTIGLAKDEYYVKRDIGISVYEIKEDGHRLGRRIMHTTMERGAEGRMATLTFTPRLLNAGNYYVETEQMTIDNIGICNDPAATEATFYQSDGDSLYSITGSGTIALRMNFGHGATLYGLDAALTEFTAPIKDKGLLGIRDSVGVRLANVGTDTITSVRITCAIDGMTMADTTADLLPYEEKTIMFHDIDLSAAGEHKISVTATLDGDENPANNTIERTVTCVEEGNPYRLDFELCDDFDYGTMFNPRWRTVDRNNRETDAWSFYDYPHKSEPVGFMAFNIDATTPPITDIPGFYPHSGERFGAAFSTSYSQEPMESDVWLISPQLQLGDNSSIRLFVKTNELDFYNKPERYRILVSDTDDSFDSFTVIGGDREAAADEWEEVNVDISEYDNKPVYIALQYISINNEGVVMMVDDVEVITNLQGTSISSAYNSADDITISSERNGISINAGEEITHVYVYSPSGQIVYAYAPGACRHAIPSSALQAGLYIVKAETANGSKTAKVKM
ncbi:uncharacterized protein BN458_00500 [Prevotella sp. CAG:1058]|nr:uncharacterized protein BN458_00500 [Prevotella sp. CAG:1058]